MVYTECAETAAVSHGTYRIKTKQRCKYTTLVDIQKHKSTVSLLENREQCCIKATNNNNSKHEGGGSRKKIGLIKGVAPQPSNPSLISCTVSVDVKHHVYLAIRSSLYLMFVVSKTGSLFLGINNCIHNIRHKQFAHLYHGYRNLFWDCLA